MSGCSKEDPVINPKVVTFTDPRDNRSYNYAQYGTKYWMITNLHYLPEVHSSNSDSYTLGRYYVYNYEGSSVAEARAQFNYSLYINTWDGTGKHTNSSGFAALAAGQRFLEEEFNMVTTGFAGGRTQANFWSSTQGRSSGTAMYRFISYDSDNVLRLDTFRNLGFSVRCVKDLGYLKKIMSFQAQIINQDLITHTPGNFLCPFNPDGYGKYCFFKVDL